MEKISYENTYGFVDLAEWSRLLAADNREQINRLKRNLARAMRQELTETQREYMILYYVQGMNMEQIAKTVGIHRSTVSKTLKRARGRLYRCLRYGAANLLEQAEKQPGVF